MTDDAGMHVPSYVCLHAFDASRPVLLVSRPDGDWCFLCGDLHDNTAESVRVVGMSHLVERDPSLVAVLDLLPEWEAERESVEGPWTRRRIVEGN